VVVMNSLGSERIRTAEKQVKKAGSGSEGKGLAFVAWREGLGGRWTGVIPKKPSPRKSHA